jgi:hypothetical protein
MKVRTILLPFTALCIVLSCGSPSKLLTSGKYDKAFDKALSGLEKGKNKRENRSVLLKAFNESIKTTEEEVEVLLVNPDIKYAVEAYETYGQLNEQYQRGKTWLSGDYSNKMSDINADQESVRLNIVDSYWAYSQEDIDNFESTEQKVYAQSAFENLERFEHFGGESPDLQTLKTTMYDAGIIKVNVKAEQRWGFSNNWDIDNTFDNLERISAKWYDITYDGSGQDYDCFMQISLSEIDYDVRQNRDTQQYSEEIQNGFTTQVDTSGNTIQIPLYETVYGSVITYRTRVTGEWYADVEWLSRNGDCEFRNSRFSANDFEDCEYYETSGDQRAIPSQFLNQSAFRDDCDVEDEIQDELLDDLYGDIRREYF